MDLQLRQLRRGRVAARSLAIGVGAALLLGHPLAAVAPPSLSWPTPEPLRVADAMGALGSNLSGLTPDGSVGLWAVRDGPGALRATTEWRLDGVLPVGAANTGIEGLAWIDDATLVSAGLRTSTGAAYRPADLPAHRGGLFVIGVEQRDELFFVALTDDGSASVIATASTGRASVMDVHWDAEHRELWAQPPSGTRSLNLEGFARLPCRDSETLVVWSDDSATNAHALREATLPCAPVVSAAARSTTSSAGVTSTSNAVVDDDDSADAPGVTSPGDGSSGPAPTILIVGAVVAAIVAAVVGACAARMRRRAQSRPDPGT